MYVNWIDAHNNQRSSICIFKKSKLSYLEQLLKTYQTYIRLSKVCKEYPMGTLLKELIHKRKYERQNIKEDFVKTRNGNWFILCSWPFCRAIRNFLWIIGLLIPSASIVHFWERNILLSVLLRMHFRFHTLVAWSRFSPSGIYVWRT